MINKKKFISIFINIILIIFVLILFFYNNISLKAITIIGFLINVYILKDYYSNSKTFKSAYFLFCFLSLPFLYGQIFTRYVLNYISKNTANLDFLVTENSMIKSVFLIIFCQLFTNLGYNFYKDFRYSRNKLEKNINLEQEKKIYIFMGWSMFLITIIPTLLDYVNDLKLVIEYGYAGKLSYVSYGYSSILSKMTPFFYYSIMILIAGYKDNKKISNLIFLCSVIFYGSQILFGNRGIPLLSVICLMFYYNYYIKKFNFKKLVLVFVIVLLLIPFLNALKSNRRYALSMWIYNAGNIIKDNYVDNNPLLELCYEMGNTIYPISYTLNVIPNSINYKYGKNYLYSLASVVKFNKSTSKNNDFILKMDIAEEIGQKAGATFGGSYIQEAYANFGWLSIVFMFAFGIVLKKLDITLWNVKSYILIIMIIYILTSLLWTIRNTMTSIPRDVFWYTIPVYIFYLMMKKRMNKNNNS